MKWMKLKAAYDGRNAGEMIQVDGTIVTEAVARALIAAGIAEDGGEGPERALSASVGAELEALRTGFARTMDGIAQDLRGVTERLNAPRVEAGVSEDEKVCRGAFRNLGHMAHAVKAASNPGGPEPASRDLVARYVASTDNVTRAVTGMSEGVDPDGGILVPADATNAIWDRVRNDEGSPVAAARHFTVSGNRLPIPAVDESSRVNGSRFGGIQAYWEGEADQLSGTKPKFRAMDLRLKKVAALVYVTDELMEDARGLDSFLSQAVPEELAFKLGDAMFRGNGSGMPLGIFNASNLFLGVTKKSGQSATTVVTENILAIWSRTYAKSRRNAAWYYNQDIEPQLGQLSLAVGSAGGQLTYTPPGGVSGSPFATLMGRPLIPSEFAETLGTVGDIGLYDWSQYALITKAGVQTAASIHLRFDYQETAFRWVLRADGQPFWNKALTPYKGSATQSPFVGVETR